MTDDNEQDPSPSDNLEPVNLAELTGSRMTPLAIEVMELHEYFCAFMDGGFTEDQALRIVSNMFSSGPNTVTIMSFDGDDEDYDEDDEDL